VTSSWSFVLQLLRPKLR